MATVKYAPHISEIHGSIQNTTYSKNRLGAYLKVRTVGIDRRTVEQITRRHFHYNAVQHWHDTLDEAHKILWNDLGLLTTFYNKAGIAYHPSGFNLFVRMYTFSIEANAHFDDDAPAAAAASPPDLLIEGQRTLTIECWVLNNWTAGKVGNLKFFVSPPLSNGIFNYSGKWYETVWFDIETIEAGPPAFNIISTPPCDEGARFAVIAKAFYASTNGNTVTWPSVHNFEISEAPP